MTQKEIKQLAEKIYEEYIFGGIGRPKYGVDFDKRHIIQALEMMVHKTREWHAKNLQKARVSGSLLADIRQAVADYMRKEGCSCCRDYEGHKINEARLGKLLKVKKYNDGSGYDFSKYRSKQ
jgi:methionine aminopeptidase